MDEVKEKGEGFFLGSTCIDCMMGKISVFPR